ncbi:hypothetical protein MNBD_GAMMA10-1263 [hydrothermal vent metagenome]|uniref:Dockerin domain-containing protein n=1 Tax=hydrothermal vent metagenome TaxID=652676 RepID=A0A3B0XYB3_9ZZZZ
MVGDNARTCWVGECDKPELWTKRLLSKITNVDGQTFSTVYSDFDKYNNPQKVVETGVGTDVSVRTTILTNFNNEANWIIGIIEDETIVGEGLIDRAFNPDGTLASESRYGVTSSFLYDTNGNLSKYLRQKDAGGSVLEDEFLDYHRGQAQIISKPENVSLQQIINDTGTVRSEKNGRGNTISYSYDGQDRIERITQPLRNPAAIDWFGANSQEIVESKSGRKKITHVDSNGKMVWESVTDIFNPTVASYISKTYNSVGDVFFVSQKTSGSKTTLGAQFEYDVLGRITKITDTSINSAISYCYGTACNSARVGKPPVKHGHVITDAEEYETVLNYRSFGNPDNQQLVEIHQQVSKTPLKYISTVIERNDLDQITKVTQAGVVRDYIYDNKKRLWKMINPETGVTVLTYDLVGNLKTREVGASGITNYTYDDLNRLTLVEFPDDGSRNISLKYDENDNLVYASNGISSREYKYNEEEQIKLETLSVEGEVFTLAYTYDFNGEINGITYPDNQYISIKSDTLGRPMWIKDNNNEYYASYIGYYPDDKVKEILYGNGLSYVMDEEIRGLPENIRLVKGNYTLQPSDLLDHTYTYDVRGNVRSIVNTIIPGQNKTLTYDGLSRLISASGEWGTGTYSYDDVGNISNKTLGGVSLNYTYDASQLLKSVTGGYSFTYDDYGNITSNGKNNFTYDDNANLRSVSGLSNILYEYDVDKNRVLEIKEGKKKFSMYSRAGSLMYTLDKATNQSSNYVYLQSKLLARVDCDALDLDSDGDRIPDCIEVRWGLNPGKALDGNLDFDDDGLSNAKEYVIGSDINDNDTDKDGISDGWEVVNNLNPNDESDALTDPDNNGLTYLQEFNLNKSVTRRNSEFLYAGTNKFKKVFSSVVEIDAKLDNKGNLFVIERRQRNTVILRFLKKLDSNGNELWFVPLYNRVRSFDIDDNGDIYIVGEFSTVDWYTGDRADDFGRMDVFVAKLSGNNGVFLQGNTFGVIGNEIADRVIVKNEDIYIAGTYQNAMTFGADSLTASTPTSNFITRLDSTLNPVWARTFGTSAGVNAIVIDKNNIYAAGEFRGTISTLVGNVTSNGGTDVYVSKWSDTGDIIWIKSFGSQATDADSSFANDTVNSMAVAKTGEIYVTGKAADESIFNASADTTVRRGPIFLVELNSSGDYVMDTLIPNQAGFYDALTSTSIALGPNGLLALTGTYTSVTDFDAGGTGDTKFAQGTDGFIRFSRGMNYEWTDVISGDIDSDTVTKIVFDVSGNYFVVGQFEGTVDFDPGEDVDNLTTINDETSSSYYTCCANGFVIKMNNIKINFGQVDTDGDGYFDIQDEFPNDPAEWQDNDGDGIGSNTDPDDDGDGMDDAWEIQFFGSVIEKGIADADGDGISNFAEFTVSTNPVINEISGAISPVKYTLKSVSSQETNSPADYAFDNDTTTNWSTKFTAADALPHFIEINLGSIHELSAFSYVPRQDAFESGLVTDYDFYTSLDGQAWQQTDAGLFAADKLTKTASFLPVQARFVRFVSLNGVRASAAEITMYANTGNATAVVPAVVTPPAGTYADQVSIVLNASTPTAFIYYTLDGTIPTVNSSLYLSPITLTSSAVIRAFVVAGGIESAVNDTVYTVTTQLPPADPFFVTIAGNYNGAIDVIVQTPTDAATIYYTTDGTVPDLTSSIYVSPVKVTATTTINTIAYSNGKYSNSLSSLYTITPVTVQAVSPLIIPAEGQYVNGALVSIKSTGEEVIYYTIDGTTPTVGSIIYIAPFVITENTTVKALSIAGAGINNSFISSATYIIQVDASLDIDGDGLDDAWEVLYFGGLANDGTGDSDNDGFSDLTEYFNNTDPTLAELFVAPNNRPVIVNPGEQQSSSGDNVSLQLSATDIDGNVLLYTATGLPPGLSLDVKTGLISGALLNSDVGSYSVAVIVSDGESTQAMSFSWAVNAGIIANGDINGDGQITLVDVLLAQQHVLGSRVLDAVSIARGDLYPSAGDGQITLSDILLLQQQVLGGQ